MTINVMSSVKELALTIPGATRVFEELGIDYCCGGNRTLVDACNNSKVTLATAVESLEHSRQTNTSESESSEWTTKPLGELVDYIIDTHHIFTRQELTRLERLIQKVCAAHEQNHPELGTLRHLTEALTAELVPHMLKEEQVLFPYISALESAIKNKRPIPPAFFVTVRNPVRMMMTEHDKAGEILRDIRKITNNFTLPPDACMTFKSLYESLQGLEIDLHQHIHLENNVLFPRAIEMEGTPLESWQLSSGKGNGGEGNGHHCFGH